MKGITPLQGEIRVKYTENLKKIFFSRTSRPNSIKLRTNYPWVKRIKVCSNKGPGPFQRGNNYKICQYGMRSLKSFLLKDCWPRKT
jgi:hypothetical protein